MKIQLRLRGRRHAATAIAAATVGTALVVGAGPVTATTVPRTTAPGTPSVSGVDLDGLEVVVQRGGIVAGPIDGELTPVAPDTPGSQEHPDWSPDGTRVVFEVDFSTLFVATLGDAGAPTAEAVFECVDPCAAAYDGAWSPDGTEIAFAMAETVDGTNTSMASIQVLTVATGETRTAYADHAGDIWLFQPRWSPDATELVLSEATFASTSLSEGTILSERIVVVAASDVGHGGAVEPRYLTDGDVAASTPDWSPDGDLIAFAQDNDVMVIAPDGLGERVVTDFANEDDVALQPTFLPDGSGIVLTYVSADTGAPTGAIIGLDGAELSVLDLGGPATHVRVRPNSD